MNLVDNPWIPVVNHAGEKMEISLLELYTDGKKYSDLAVRPHERVALMRLFICVAQAALSGPEDDDELEDAPEILPEAAQDYLNEWKDSFDLFHKEKPFLQIAHLKCDGEKTPVSKLDFALASGNNSTLFDQKGDDTSQRAFTISELAIGLLTFLNFNSGGLLSVVTWGSHKSSKAGNSDCPCLKGAPYHTYLRGINVFETICLNIVSKDSIIKCSDSGSEFSYSMGVPVWEYFPENVKDKMAIKNATETYLGRLVPLSRLIKIDDNKAEMIWGGGFKYKVFPEFPFAEPSISTYIYKDKIKNTDERAVVSASHSKAIWRDLSSLIISRDVNNIGAPIIFLNLNEYETYDIHVCSLIRNQAIIEAAHESVFTLSPEFRSKKGYGLYHKEITYLNGVSSSLGVAVEVFRQHIDESWGQRVRQAGKDKRKLLEKLKYVATDHYWTTVEKELPLLMSVINALGNKEKLDKLRSLWRNKINEIARDSYSIACGRDSPRHMHAYVMGLKNLIWKNMTEEQE